MADYYLTSYQAEQPLPTCREAGVRKTVYGSVTPSAALTTSDNVYMFRVPANHRVVALEVYTADADSGSTVTVNIGTQASGSTFDDADAFCALNTDIIRSNALQRLPVASGAVANTTAPATWYTNSTPTVDYDVVLTLGAGPATSAGLIAARIFYTKEITTLWDATDSPSVVAGTQ